MFLLKKVGGTNDTISPHFEKWGGFDPPVPSPSDAHESFSCKHINCQKYGRPNRIGFGRLNLKIKSDENIR